MADIILIGNRVRARQDIASKEIYKGNAGVVYGIVINNCKAFLYIELDNGKKVESVPERFFDKIH